MNNEEIIDKLLLYSDGLFPPNKNWPDEEFKRRSYARYVFDDLLKRLYGRPFDDGVNIIYLYVIELTHMHDIFEDNLVYEYCLEAIKDIYNYIRRDYA